MTEILWAPWRMQYIKNGAAKTATGDIFVDLPAEADDRKNLIVHRGAAAFVMLNRFPYANGHLLVAPYRQVANLAGLNDTELLEINQLLAKCEVWLTAAMNPSGFNVGVNLGKAAGAGVPVHIHWHMVPRWDGDANFMAVTADTRVIPQSLEDTYDSILEVIAAQS